MRSELAQLVVLQKKAAGELLNDERFKDLFGNPDFEVDKQSEHYQKLAEKMQKLKERDVGRPEEASDDSEAEDEDMESSSAVEGTSSADASEQSEQSDLEQEEQTEPPKRKKTFKLVGLDTSRDFNSFVPSTAEDDPALRVSFLLSPLLFRPRATCAPDKSSSRT